MGQSDYRERPAALGAGWVACTWTRRRPAGAAPVLIVPDGCVDLIWDGASLQVAGPDTGPRHSTLGTGSRLSGVRLRPGASRPLLGAVPAGEVVDHQPTLDLLWPSVDRLAARLATLTPAGAAAVLERELVARAREFAPDPVALRAVAALDRPHPPSLGALARDLGLSDRQLRRRLTDAVGYGPRTLHGILRFQRAARLARAEAGSWAGIATGAGYADQPHLTREFRRWSGRTPEQSR